MTIKIKNEKNSKIQEASIKCDERRIYNDDQRLKKALDILTGLRVNVYQKLYYLVNASPETWRQFDFLSSETKVNNFISVIEREIKYAKDDNFNLEKYKPAIECILGAKNIKFNDAIIKNMYVAKLQNVIFLLKEKEGNGEISEVKSSKPNILR